MKAILDKLVANPTLISTALGFCVLALAFGPLERVFPARPKQRVIRSGWAVDLGFFLGQYLVFAGAAGAVLSAVSAWVDAHSLAVIRLWASQRPLWVQVLLSIALGDVMVYWFHRACHHYDLLWRFHAVHHSAEELDWLAAHREHPLDGIGTQICLNLPAFIVGLPFEAAGTIVVLRGMWAVFIHSNVRLPVGPLRFLLGAPELHHFHHARVERTAHNFANLAPWVDVLFGTYHRPNGPETYPLGITDPWPKGYFAQLIRPFVPDRVWRAAEARWSARSLRASVD